MFCSYCGEKLVPGAEICTRCGKEVPSFEKASQEESSLVKPALKNQRGRYFLLVTVGTFVGAILLAVVLFISGVFSSGDIRIEGPGFSTPEDAAKAYLTGLKDQDLDAMLSVFAVESYVDHFDFEDYLDYLMSYQSDYEIMIPNTNDYSRELNISSRARQISGQIISQYMLFNMFYNNNTNAADILKYYDKTIVFNDPQEVRNFIEKFERNTENYIFDNLVIIGTELPEDIANIYLNEAIQKDIARQAVTFGVGTDDLTNVFITLEVDGQIWFFCPQLIRYNNRWYIQTLNGELANLMASRLDAGGIIPDLFSLSKP